MALYNWIEHNKRLYRSSALPQERIDKFEEVGFKSITCKQREDSETKMEILWNKRLEELKAFNEKVCL